MARARHPNDHMFAVAVRDGSDLFLWLRLRRNWKGEIFYVYPTGPKTETEWDPHGSKHADGVGHHKSREPAGTAENEQRRHANSHYQGRSASRERPSLRVVMRKAVRDDAVDAM